MNNKLIGIIFLFSLTSCQTLWVDNDTQRITNNKVILGSIGEVRGNSIVQDYQSLAFPVFKEKILLDIEFMPFHKQTYKAYVSATKQQAKKIDFIYIDSLQTQNNFVQLQIADQEKALQSLQQNYNASTLQWLQQNPRAKMLISVSLYVNEQQTRALQEADQVFLVTQPYKNNVLQLYSKGLLQQTITFSATIPFAYHLAGFCWGKNNKNQWVLGSLTKETKPCIKGQYKSYKEATAPKSLFDY